MKAAIGLVLFGASCVACKSTPDHELPPAANTAVPAPAAEPATAAVTGPRQPADHGLFKEDYEAQASTQITAANVDGELDALEQEITRAETVLEATSAQ